MIFSLDVQRARKGDCLLLHYGTRGDPGLALIDGGPGRVYKPHLKPRLGQIRQARGLAPEAPLVVDLLMVSHIDDDHINGILEMTRELVLARDSHRPLPLKVRSFWHNTFDDLVGNNPEELLSAVTASFGAAALSGEPDTEGLDADAAMVLASVAQGFRLRDDARKLNFRLNPEFQGRLVMATPDSQPVDMGRGLTLTVAGPMQADLLALQKDHDAFLKARRDDKPVAASLAALTDSSVANLSSLVLLAQVEEKRILLTGDARSDKILRGLELIGLMKEGGTLHVDILKMPHHGSDRNVDPDFFQRITADHYVFSGNGEHGNPERATLQMLLDASCGRDLTVHLTYPLQEIDANRQEDWKKEQDKEKTRKGKNPELAVREDWSHGKHSLTAFLEDHEDFARKISVVAGDKPHCIDLLETVGF